jgi:hypothetical protein
MPTTMSRVTMPAVDATYSGSTAGTAPGVIATPANGDLIPISSGNGTLLAFRTTGTLSVITIANVVAPAWGSGGNLTVSLAATDFQFLYLHNDGVDRFDQGGANAGLVSLSYSSVTGLTVYAVTIP